MRDGNSSLLHLKNTRRKHKAFQPYIALDQTRQRPYKTRDSVCSAPNLLGAIYLPLSRATIFGYEKRKEKLYKTKLTTRDEPFSTQDWIENNQNILARKHFSAMDLSVALNSLVQEESLQRDLCCVVPSLPGGYIKLIGFDADGSMLGTTNSFVYCASANFLLNIFTDVRIPQLEPASQYNDFGSRSSAASNNTHMMMLCCCSVIYSIIYFLYI